MIYLLSIAIFAGSFVVLFGLWFAVWTLTMAEAHPAAQGHGERTHRLQVKL